MYVTPNGKNRRGNSPRVLFEAEAPFVFTAKVAPDYARKWHAGVLLVYGDDDHFAKLCFERDPTSLAKALGVHKTTTWYWWTGAAHSSLRNVVCICGVLGVRVVDTLTSVSRSRAVAGCAGVHLEFHLSSRAPARKINWRNIRKHLEAEIAVPLEEARALAAVGRDLSVAVRTLRSREPELCRAIGRRFLDSRRLIVAARDDRLKQEIRCACESLRESGYLFSSAALAMSLGRPGLFCRPAARRLLAEVLGWDYRNWPKEVTVPGRRGSFLRAH